MLQIGSILDNKYKILNRIGAGGMSVVYLAINERANKTWAVKEVRKDGVIDFESVKQNLIVETDMLKKLRHPNLPSIIDVIDTDDCFLIIMDYIEGMSLQKLLQISGAQPEEQVMKWAEQLCDVLGYLHRQKPPIIYRDMKPSNIMLKPDGSIALIDFGTAREFKSRAKAEDTTCLGTRGYAAPEQFGGRGQSDARTDIYCLGATLYHLLTGCSPAEPPYEIKPLSYWLPQYSGTGLEKMILKCTRQDPDQRYQDCEELMYAILHYHDEDDRAQRKRKKQWRAFLIAAITGLAGIVGMIGCRILLNQEKQASHESLVKMAQQEQTIDASESYLLQAMQLDPGAWDAYEVMLEIVETDRTENHGAVTAAATTFINRCLNATPNGKQRNVDVLARKNPEKYTSLMYNIGLLYFFVKDSGDGDKETASKNYFSRIIEDPYIRTLSESQAELAVLLEEIGRYIGSLDRENDKYLDNPATEGYQDLYTSINEILEGDLKEKVGREIYCIKIYEQAANWIDVREAGFREAGVSVSQLRSSLKTAESRLKELKVSTGSENYEDYEQALRTVANAWKTLNAGENNTN